jgi:hypothetical protein
MALLLIHLSLQCVGSTVMRNASRSWQCRVMRQILYARSQSVTLVSIYLPYHVILVFVFTFARSPVYVRPVAR